jgi:hypothetical protein
VRSWSLSSRKKILGIPIIVTGQEYKTGKYLYRNSCTHEVTAQESTIRKQTSIDFYVDKKRALLFKYIALSKSGSHARRTRQNRSLDGKKHIKDEIPYRAGASLGAVRYITGHSRTLSHAIASSSLLIEPLCISISSSTA